MTDMQLVYVEWIDSAGFAEGGWHQRDVVDSLGPHVISSVGWIIKEEDDYIVMCSHISSDGTNLAGEKCIPKVAIQKRKKIKL